MCLSTGNKISRIVAGFVVLLGATATAPGQAVDKATSEPIPFADGVIDSQLRTVFVSTAKGGIQAIELLTGGVTWTNDDCLAQPWLVAGQRLIARGDRLFVLDLKNGKVLRPCDAIDFPKVDVPERCTVSFPLWEPRVSGETLEARWFAVAHIDRSKGRPFPFQAWTAFNKSAPAGALKVNLETGGVTLPSIITWPAFNPPNAAASDDKNESDDSQPQQAPDPQPAAEAVPDRNRTAPPIVPAAPSTSTPSDASQPDSLNGVKTPQQIYEQLQHLRQQTPPQ